MEGLSLVEALWARMCAGYREDGTPIEANDPNWNAQNASALAARDRPLAWLDQTHVYGDLANDPRFREAFERWLGHIWSEDTATALAAYGSLYQYTGYF